MTDETEVSLIATPNTKNDIIWAPRGEDVSSVEVDPYAQTLRFWAGASAKGRTKLHFFEGNLDGEGYLKILDSALPEMNGIFGEGDGRSNMTEHQHILPERLMTGSEPTCLRLSNQWPAKSPDLNWIENLWGILQAKW